MNIYVNLVSGVGLSQGFTSFDMIH